MSNGPNSSSLQRCTPLLKVMAVVSEWYNKSCTCVGRMLLFHFFNRRLHLSFLWLIDLLTKLTRAITFLNIFFDSVPMLSLIKLFVSTEIFLAMRGRMRTCTLLRLSGEMTFTWWSCVHELTAALPGEKVETLHSTYKQAIELKFLVSALQHPTQWRK